MPGPGRKVPLSSPIDCFLSMTMCYITTTKIVFDTFQRFCDVVHTLHAIFSVTTYPSDGKAYYVIVVLPSPISNGSFLVNTHTNKLTNNCNASKLTNQNEYEIFNNSDENPTFANGTYSPSINNNVDNHTNQDYANNQNILKIGKNFVEKQTTYRNGSRRGLNKLNSNNQKDLKETSFPSFKDNFTKNHGHGTLGSIHCTSKENMKVKELGTILKDDNLTRYCTDKENMKVKDLGTILKDDNITCTDKEKITVESLGAILENITSDCTDMKLEDLSKIIDDDSSKKDDNSLDVVLKDRQLLPRDNEFLVYMQDGEDVSMREERFRLQTFSHYPRNSCKSPVLLASNGFMYAGDGSAGDDSVVCYFCRLIVKNWREGDVEEVHKELSPNCPMVTGINCDNVPLGFLPKEVLVNFYKRASCSEVGLYPGGRAVERKGELDSNKHTERATSSTSSIAASTELAEEQAPHTPSSQSSENDNASTVISNSEPTNQSETPQQSSGTTSTTTVDRRNSRSLTYSELGIITERPKRLEYVHKLARLRSFTDWPRGHHLTPEELASCGFYFAGYGDCARCFYCGGGLRNWEDEDDVWVEHARWFPRCAFIRQQMGQVFVDTVQKLNEDHDEISLQMVMNEMGTSTSTFQLDGRTNQLERDPAVLTVIDMGYNRNDAVSRAQHIKEQNSILSADTLLEDLQQTTAPSVERQCELSCRSSAGNGRENLESIRLIKEQNNRLRQQTVCKICMDKEVAVVFLPCGHLASCADCASAMRDCPICRVNVRGIVRAFMS
ncbi:death-associated inhibitor of apoptosis 2-like isoform X2 [Physella acuta]|uniref:death-associated inhibitor of apoptosis 2-like isoform X2 n=1 Tax=Physella acuta TaxID=109671 RepID=UPI0027DCC1BA|nr:death-associated inhibitor of apoptosis 2-like isoform X2 [Physella acuta]